jgi:hypothetical protein
MTNSSVKKDELTLRVQNQFTIPLYPSNFMVKTEGSLIWDSRLLTLFVSDGTQWVEVFTGIINNNDLADMPPVTIKGNNTGIDATPQDLTATEVTAMLDVFTDVDQGLVPASGGNMGNFLMADGTWSSILFNPFTEIYQAWVDPVSGDDNNLGTQLSPWLTITRVAEDVSNYQKISIAQIFILNDLFFDGSVLGAVGTIFKTADSVQFIGELGPLPVPISGTVTSISTWAEVPIPPGGNFINYVTDIVGMVDDENISRFLHNITTGANAPIIRNTATSFVTVTVATISDEIEVVEPRHILTFDENLIWNILSFGKPLIFQFFQIQAGNSLHVQNTNPNPVTLLPFDIDNRNEYGYASSIGFVESTVNSIGRYFASATNERFVNFNVSHNLCFIENTTNLASITANLRRSVVTNVSFTVSPNRRTLSGVILIEDTVFQDYNLGAGSCLSNESFDICDQCQIRGCVFTRNTTGLGNGIIRLPGRRVSVQNCSCVGGPGTFIINTNPSINRLSIDRLVVFNTTIDGQGTLTNGINQISFGSEIQIINCRISNCTSDGMFIANSVGTITGCSSPLGANGGFGINFVANCNISVLTANTISGTSGDVNVGALGTKTWAEISTGEIQHVTDTWRLNATDLSRGVILRGG